MADLASLSMDACEENSATPWRPSSSRCGTCPRPTGRCDAPCAGCGGRLGLSPSGSSGCCAGWCHGI